MHFRNIVVLLFLCPVWTWAQERMSFEACLTKANENNIQLKQAEQQLMMADINEAQSKYNLLPSFNGQVSISNSFGKTIDPSTNFFIDNGVRSTSMSLSGNLPLFAGLQRWKSIRQAGVNKQKSEYDLEKARNDVALLMATAYLQVLLSEEVVKASEGRLELLNEQLSTTKTLVDAGRLPESNLLEMKAQIAAEQFSRANAQTQYETARLQLAQLMGLEDYRTIQLQRPDVLVADSFELSVSQDEIIKSAMERFPQIKSAEQNIVSNELGLQISRCRYSPTLSLNGVAFTQGTSTLYDFGVSYGDQFEQFFRKQISLGLNIPFLNNLTVRTGIRQSRVQLEMARLNFQNTQNQLQNDVQKAFLEVQSAYQNYLAAVAQFETMDQSLKSAKVRFENNMLSGTDYRVSINNKSKAESDLIQAKYRYVFNSKILDFYLGNEIKF